MALEWEVFINIENDNGATHSARLPVFGGWAVMHLFWNNHKRSQSESMCFVPDKDHEWEL